MPCFFGKFLFAGGDGYGELIFVGWFGAGITACKGTIRVISFVKIDSYAAVFKVGFAELLYGVRRFVGITSTIIHEITAKIVSEETGPNFR
jgi:hypothetical protein